MLAVIESDFTKGITKMVACEQVAADTSKKQTKEDDIEKTTKEQDVKYKTKDFTGLDKKVGELTSERSGVEDELKAVNDYLASLAKKCTYKVETNVERKARRASEIDGWVI